MVYSYCGNDAADSSLHLVAPSGQTLSFNDPTPSPVAPATATPFLLDPVDHIQCNVNNNADHTVTWWTAKRTINFNGGRVDLKCGNDNVGYKHIKSRHQSEWQTRANEVGGGAWDDMMNFAVKAALESPSASYIETGSKACYTAPIQVRNSSGTVIKTWYPTVIISLNNKIIITAFPGGGCLG